MVKSVKIPLSFVEKIHGDDETLCDLLLLLGVFESSTGDVSVLNFANLSGSSSERHEILRQVWSSLPAGIDVVGFAAIDADPERIWIEEISLINSQIECFRPDVVLLSSDKKNLSVFSYNLITFAKIEVEHEVIKESNFGDDWITVFCPTALEIQFAIPDDDKTSLSAALLKSCNAQFLDFQYKFAFRLANSSSGNSSSKNSVLLTSTADFCNAKTVKAFYEIWQGDDFSAATGKKSTNRINLRTNCMEMNLLQKMTGGKLCADMFNSVPLIYHENGNFEYCRMKFDLLAVACLNLEADVKKIHKLLLISLFRQIHAAIFCVRNFSDENFSNFCLPESLLFYPQNFPYPLSIPMPKKATDSELESYRRRLHHIWHLPETIPIFRKGNQHLFPHQENSNILRNVHLFVPPSGVNGEISTVKGNYQYHHYMQNGFDDKGWGCAYRSFQTIWSWFLLQGYTEKSVPSHSQIQKTLVECGDREASFVGTKQWIGSLELSYCLNQLLEVSSRILSISSGLELQTKAREIFVHFETQGTPIMIGGGVLAHTILGVDFDENSGDVKFLVLDPHYTGEENIKTIVEKGWCGWKPVSFWDENAFYNLLLPFRPHVL